MGGAADFYTLADQAMTWAYVGCVAGMCQSLVLHGANLSFHSIDFGLADA